MMNYKLWGFFSVIVLLDCSIILGQRPFDGKTFRGRIAYSCDGNFNDPDDWAASPMALALMGTAGVQDRLVHFHYNSILWANEAIWERRHEEAVLEAVSRFGFDKDRFFNCRRNPEEAVAHLARQIQRSNHSDPLYIILAGPVDILLAALKRSSPSACKHVYVISHSRWNEGFRGEGEEPALGEFHGISLGHTKRDVLEMGVRWVQIPDQNPTLSAARYVRASTLGYPTHSRWAPSRPEEFAPYFWLRDSHDPKFRFLWYWLETSTRPDCSDAGMTYFLLTGDPVATPQKLHEFLSGQVKAPPAGRDTIRLEAENFIGLENYKIVRMDRRVSHSLAISPVSPQIPTRLHTVVDEPYVADTATYATFLAYRGKPGLTFTATLVGAGQPLPSVEVRIDNSDWNQLKLGDISLRIGDPVEIRLEGTLPELDYLELRRTSDGGAVSESTSSNSSLSGAQLRPGGTVHERFAVTGPLDNVRALPGQVIVAERRAGFAGYLKVNGGRALFLCGPDNPEEFLYLGRQNPDGTRVGPQMEIINLLGQTGVNALHCQIFRMRACNIKNEGDDTHCPFIDNDPTKGLNPRILDQWDTWFAELERRGIVVHLEFYNDATDVTRMGWELDASGNLHPQERAFIEGIVRRFMHRRNIIWGIEESSNKLPRKAVSHFQKVAELIRQTDAHDHPIVQSLVTPETAERDIHPDMVGSEDYRDDPHIDIITWLHIPPRAMDFEAQYQAYLGYAWRDRDRFIVMKNETEYHPIDRRVQRIHQWAAALAGMHALEAQLNAARRDRSDRIFDSGLVVQFMEQTDWYRMKPDSNLARGSTRWVLSQPARSYILFTYSYESAMGLSDLPPGQYELLWYDATSGKREVRKVHHEGGPASWERPPGFGAELAVYVRRVD
ncbi:MAG: hypothetical protein KatS3mg110_3235 [Pirellulaceae bacterium]|nr:MAG: hypothetical protein KatS3mg110_3235 [Pirellulaceae bacterium]